MAQARTDEGFTVSLKLVPHEDDVVLLEVDDEGTFLAFGRELEGHELLPLSFLGDHDRGELGRFLAESSGALNLGVQALNGYNQMQGLVRFAPETLQALRAGAQPLVKEGWNLGTLTTGSGKFAQQVRWLPAGSAGAVSALASVGPSVALIAIQWQLGKIQKLVERNLELTGEVLHAVRSSDWAEARGHHNIVMRGLAEAQHLGAVTPAVWNNLQSQAAQVALEKHLDLYLAAVQRHYAQLRTMLGSVARRQWLEAHGAAVLRDVESLLMAQQAWLVYQVLRAAFLARTAADDPQDAKLLPKVVDDARATHRAALRASEPLIDGLYRHFKLAEVCPGGRGLRIGEKAAAAKDVAAATAVLSEHLKAMGCSMEDPPAGTLRPRHGWVGTGAKTMEASDRFRWLLQPGEQVVAVAYGSTSHWNFLTSGYTLFTDRRILMCRDKQLMNDGLVDHELRWAQVNNVEISKDKGWGGLKDIVLSHGKDKTRIEFDSKTGDAAVASLVRSLKAAREASPTSTEKVKGHGSEQPPTSPREDAFRQLRERLLLAGADERQKELAHDAFSRSASSLHPLPFDEIVEDSLFEASAARRDERKAELRLTSAQSHEKHCLCGCSVAQRRGRAEA